MASSFRIGLWDLETTSLSADPGYILCGVVKDYHERLPKVFRVDDFNPYPTESQCDCGRIHWGPKQDRPMIMALREELDNYDILVSYNGIDYDTTFLNTRLLFCGEKGLDQRYWDPRVHKDLLRITRKALRLTNNRLDTVARYFNFPVQKTPVDLQKWVAAANGCKTHLDEIVTHCKKDVLVLQETFDTLKTQLNIRW